MSPALSAQPSDEPSGPAPAAPHTTPAAEPPSGVAEAPAPAAAAAESTPPADASVTQPAAAKVKKHKKDKSNAGDEPTAATKPDESDGKDKKGDKESPFKLKGRIIARAELAQRNEEYFDANAVRGRRDIESLELFLPSARVGFEYKTPIKGVRAVMSAEFTGRVKLKDAYVQARGDFAGVRVGQFKPPGSPIETDSRLSLPTVDRGFIHDILTERLEVGDRRPGVSVFVFDRDGMQPELTLAVIQGSYLADEAARETELYGPDNLGAQTLVARAEATPLLGTQFGAYATNRVGTDELPEPDEAPDRFWAGGLDVRLDWLLGPGGLRFWLDGTLGESWFRQTDKAGDDRPLFGAVRSILAYRFGGIEKGDVYVEPYGSVGVLDPDIDVTADMAWEGALGVNAGFWERGKLSLQATTQGFQRNFPSSYVLDDFRRRAALALQVGVGL